MTFSCSSPARAGKTPLQLLPEVQMTGIQTATGCRYVTAATPAHLDCLSDVRRLRWAIASKENAMPWYAWLIIVLALGSILGSLLLLRDSARRLPLTEEQLKRIRQRNAEQDAKDAEER